MRPRCPACGADDVVPVVYGFPSADMLDAAERGEIVLGGCVVDPDSPGIIAPAGVSDAQAGQKS